jgi:hypothetical protein
VIYHNHSKNMANCIQVAESPPPPPVEVKEVEPEPEPVRILQLPFTLQRECIAPRDKIAEFIQVVDSPPPPPEEETKEPQPVSKFLLWSCPFGNYFENLVPIKCYFAI